MNDGANGARKKICALHISGVNGAGMLGFSGSCEGGSRASYVGLCYKQFCFLCPCSLKVLYANIMVTVAAVECKE